MNEAQQRMSAAKRALRLAEAKRTRRIARIEKAVRAFQDSTIFVHGAQADLKVAEEDYDRTCARVAARVSREQPVKSPRDLAQK